MSSLGEREGMCVYHNSSEAVRIRSGSDGPGHAIIAGPLSSLSSPSSSTLIPSSHFTSAFMHVYNVRGRPSSHEGWVEDAKRGLLGGIGLNRGGILPKRGLEVLGFVTIDHLTLWSIAPHITLHRGALCPISPYIMDLSCHRTPLTPSLTP
jgi:hypothetical protein